MLLHGLGVDVVDNDAARTGDQAEGAHPTRTRTRSRSNTGAGGRAGGQARGKIRKLEAPDN